MLGMRALTKRDPDLAWEKLSLLNHAREDRLSIDIERLDTNELVTDQIRTFTFSDTVIAFSKGNTANDALAIVLLMNELFMYSLHLCVPLRGGIAHGRFAFNLGLNLFSGPALVDAYAFGESAQWLGIVLDPYTAQVVSQLPNAKVGGHGLVVTWDVQCKDGTFRPSSVVNWPQSHRGSYEGVCPISAEDFYAPFESLFGAFELLGPDVKRKYTNTVAFFNAHFDC